MRAGALRARIIVERLVEGAQDAVGAPTRTWTEVARIWGAVLPLSARQSVGADQSQTEARIQVRTRWTSSITPGMRARWDGRVYTVVDAVDADGGRRAMLITLRAVEGAA